LEKAVGKKVNRSKENICGECRWEVNNKEVIITTIKLNKDNFNIMTKLRREIDAKTELDNFQMLYDFEDSVLLFKGRRR
jgi:hypothetical protein